MYKANRNFSLVSESYLFSTIARRVDAYKAAHPEADIIRLGIGDVTRPLCQAAVEALKAAADAQADANTFTGYGPEQGHRFLIDAIIEGDYRSRGIEIDLSEVFVSDGAKSDIGNIGDILSVDNVVAITDPVYPVYLDTNIMAGRRVMLLDCLEANGFRPSLPSGQAPDIIYLCYPNNPTGTSLTRAELKMWVDYALANGCLILFDSAYEAYITRDDVPHSIYEIEGARRCAIEFRSFSKTAGFTGLRCGYTVVPRELTDADGTRLNDLWRRRQCTKFNGASVVVQHAAAALYTAEGRRQVRADIGYYMANAGVIRQGLSELGFNVYGGVDSPYVWAKAPVAIDSWQLFDLLLERCNVVVTPGVGFGKCGEGYIRLTSFNSHQKTREAINRIKSLNFNNITI
ncbi:MAG: LL-diaminopimelate aminotransferase [Muribaculaceae bacterium]|nr:LL-diaminopimelate aminotransferase [Muribaculaceae bacterium]